MDSPSIGLRFRDTTPGVDTIDAHRQIIKENGSVWWGWWKKEFEDPHSDHLSKIGNQFTAIIINIWASRMFLARVTELIVSPEHPNDIQLIPEYYRDIEIVYAWFRLESIEEIDYDQNIADKFGDDDTFVEIGKPNINARRKERFEIHKSSKGSILVLSDLHFGPDYDFLQPGQIPKIGDNKLSLTDSISMDLERIGCKSDIAAILITGDFTSYGEWKDQTISDICSEIHSLRKELNVDVNSILTLPGNHDVVRYPEDRDVDVAQIAVEQQAAYEHERGYRFFLASLLNKSVQEPLDFVKHFALNEVDLLVGALNSCRILATRWTEYGFVGTQGINTIKQLGSTKTERSTFRLLAIHHHLLPVNKVEAPNEKGVTLSLDASLILSTAQSAGVHIAIHGHQHMPHVARYQNLALQGEEDKAPIVVVSNGSSGVSASRRPGDERNTYCILTSSKTDMVLRMRELRTDGKPGVDLFYKSLGITPSDS